MLIKGKFEVLSYFSSSFVVCSMFGQHAAYKTAYVGSSFEKGALDLTVKTEVHTCVTLSKHTDTRAPKKLL